MKAAEDFLEVVVEAHVMAAANSVPDNAQISSVQVLAERIVKTFIHLKVGETTDCDDGVYLYACDLLILGMIWMGFHDAIREGDGERVMLYWKFLLVVFKLTGRKNYSIEAVHIQLMRHHHLSERQSAQLVWSRFINTHGRRGKNIPCDLHMEHLNKCLKDSLRHLHSNIKPKSIQRAAKAIGVVHHIIDLFEKEITGQKDSGKHSKPRISKDFQCILSELTSLKVFEVVSKRDHDSVHIKKNLLQKFSTKKYLEWVRNHIY